MKDYNSTFIAFLIFIFFSLLAWFAIAYFKEETKKEKTIYANEILDKVMRVDKEKRGENFLKFFSMVRRLVPKSDSISIRTNQGVKKFERSDSLRLLPIEEKIYIAQQMYLLRKNPIRVKIVDSLFQATLKEKDISAETAMIYTANGKSEISNPDSMFYKKAIALNVIRVGFKGESFELQAFVKLPLSYLLSKAPHFWTIILLWIGGTFLLIGWIIRRRQASIALPIEQSEQFPQNPNGLVVPITASPQKWLQITESLLFDEEKGELSYNGQIIYLTRKSLRLFSFLLKGENYYQNYENIKKEVWKDENASNDAIRKMVNQLNNKLASIPNLSIEIENKLGYQIKLNNL